MAKAFMIHGCLLDPFVSEDGMLGLFDNVLCYLSHRTDSASVSRKGDQRL